MEALALKDTFENVYQNYHPVLTMTAYSKTGNMDDAEDICQDLFLHFYNNSGNIRKEKNWLNGVLRNLISAYYCDARKKGEAIPAFNISDTIAHSFSDEAIETRMVLKDVFKSNEVFEDQKDERIFFLYILNDNTCEEVSTRLNMTKKQVYYRTERIKRRIKYYLRLKGIKEIKDLI